MQRPGGGRTSEGKGGVQTLRVLGTISEGPLGTCAAAQGSRADGAGPFGQDKDWNFIHGKSESQQRAMTYLSYA